MYISIPVVCQPLPNEATCDQSSISIIANGNMSNWECRLLAAPSTIFNLLLNENVIHPSQPGMMCGNESQVIFLVQEEPQNVCFSSFNFTVFICSVNEAVVGDFSIINSSGDAVAGTNITVLLMKEPDVVSTSQGTTSSLLYPPKHLYLCTEENYNIIYTSPIFLVANLMVTVSFAQCSAISSFIH